MTSPGSNFACCVLYKMLYAPKVVRRLVYQGADDACQFLCQPIGDGTPTGHDGS